jgi:hypothetical protein
VGDEFQPKPAVWTEPQAPLPGTMSGSPAETPNTYPTPTFTHTSTHACTHMQWHTHTVAHIQSHTHTYPLGLAWGHEAFYQVVHSVLRPLAGVLQGWFVKNDGRPRVVLPAVLEAYVLVPVARVQARVRLRQPRAAKVSVTDWTEVTEQVANTGSPNSPTLPPPQPLCTGAPSALMRLTTCDAGRQAGGRYSLAHIAECTGPDAAVLGSDPVLHRDGLPSSTTTLHGARSCLLGRHTTGGGAHKALQGPGLDLARICKAGGGGVMKTQQKRQFQGTPPSTTVRRVIADAQAPPARVEEV